MILVTGSLAFDYIMDFPGVFIDHINTSSTHKINVSFLIDKLKKGYGGTAGNIAYNMALLNIRPMILGSVGEDFNEYKNFLTNSGVDTSGIKTIKGEFSSQAYIVTDQKDDQIAAFYPGAMNSNKMLRIADLSEKPEIVLITPGGVEAMMNFVSECKALGIPYMFDPSQHITALSDEQIKEGLQGAKIFINNDYEYEMIKKRLEFSDEQFLDSAEIVIITKGAQGSVIKTKQGEINIKAAKTDGVSDPTGAGDAYRAGFICGFQKKLDLKICGQMGAIASCYTIEKYGTTSHTFSLEVFRARYKQNFGEELTI